jgi:hypothetical protein
VALIEVGRPREANPYLIQSTEESPCDAAIRANLVLLSSKVEMRERHLYGQRGGRGNPSNTQLIVTLAILCFTHGQAQKNRHLFENASELIPTIRISSWF